MDHRQAYLARKRQLQSSTQQLADACEAAMKGHTCCTQLQRAGHLVRGLDPKELVRQQAVHDTLMRQLGSLVGRIQSKESELGSALGAPADPSIVDSREFRSREASRA